ncbi:MAG: hypothetical protein NXI09_04810 [Bacteroidetes bacterium]|nr:hypothetical protein [Bacteroidota bacterium]
MRLRKILFILFIGLLLGGPLSLHAQKSALDLKIELWADSSGRTSFIEMRSNEKLLFSEEDEVTFDKSTPVYWLRIKIPAGDKGQTAILKAKYLDSLEVYIANKEGRYPAILSGENIPLANRPIAY